MRRLWWILTFSWFVINLKCKKHERLLPESYATARNRLLKLMESGAFTRSVFIIILFWSFSCARLNFDIINRHISWQQVLRMTGDLVYDNFSSIQKQSANWHTGSFSFENFLHSKEIHQLLITFYEIYNPWSLQGPPYRRENYLHVEYRFPFFFIRKSTHSKTPFYIFAVK